MTQARDTLPKLLLQRAQHRGGRDPAIREKEFGIWQSYSWAEYLANVRAFALGLARLGVQRGDKLAIIGDNRPQLYWALVAAEAVGGIPVPVYQDAIAPEIQYVIDHSDSKVVVAEDQEQVDKILELKDKLPGVEHVIFDDPKGMRHYAFPFLRSFAQVQELGREMDNARPAYFSEEVAKGAGEDVAIINYTSGTTGFPKGVILTHRNLIATAENLLKVDRVGKADQLMAYLPMAWIGDTFFSVVVSFVTGACVNCPEDTTTVRHDFREIGPTVTFAPPRIWENLLSQAQVKIEDADWLKRRLAHGLLPVAMRVATLGMEGKPVPWSLRLLMGLGKWLVFAPLRDQLGLRRLRWATTGGAPMGPEVLQFFRGIGVNLKQIYGLTESSAPATLQRDGAVKADSAGPPIPGVEVSISPGGEVLLRAPGLFTGYYKDPEATARTLREGWLATGDAGFLDPDGHLVIIDRAKDVSHLLDGSVFAPQYIENKLKFSPYVKEAVAAGHERPYVAAMINIDTEVVGNWAERRGIPYSGYADLSQNPQVYELIHREVQRVNRTLTPALRIRRFVLLHKELDPDDAEITRTRKLRRRFVNEKYGTIIDALYDHGAREVQVKAVVTYEDGRTSETERSLNLLDVAEA
ncbi:MAG: AMP-binding protein [Candidatus Rokubacteria bacterium]|nr:AMP-binding protein [Candidatus Rokubacteria bacterium]